MFLTTVTFEDKKRENFERGNLELEKRRQALQEQQRKEQERLAALEREEQERKVHNISIHYAISIGDDFCLHSSHSLLYQYLFRFCFLKLEGNIKLGTNKG